MKKGFRSGLFALMAIVLVMGSVLAGCGKKDDAAEKSDDKQVFRFNLHSEPPSLDSGIAQDQTSFTVLTAIMEGLTRMNAKGEVEKAVAKDWTISEDGKKYTFTLRDDAKWSNGDPVKASDFEYAWKRVLDPATASPYAYQLYYLKNAQEYNEKKITDASQVGVKATGDYTLEVELNSATPYFLSLVGFFTYFPVNEKVVKANPKWAAEADTLVSNGAFKIDEWKHNDHIKLVKNKDFFNKDEIKLDEVHMSMVNDVGTELSMYQTDQLDWSGRPTGEIPTDQIPTLKADKKANLQIKGIASTYFYSMNTTAEPFDNLNIRKAFAMSVDRQELVDKVTLGEQQPAYGFVPPGIKGEKDEFRKEYKEYFEEDLEQAKELLNKGMEEKGYKKLPSITLIHNEGEGHKKIAAALADMWRKNLGVEVKVESQEWGVLINNRNNKNYQIARDGWGADYNDAMTFIDMWTSKSGNNNTGFASKEYDDLVKKAYSTSDAKERIEAMAQAEKIFIEQMPIIPLYYYTGIWMQKKYVKDVFIDYSGNIDFTRGYIKK